MFFTKTSKAIAWLIFVPSVAGYGFIMLSSVIGTPTGVADFLGIKPSLLAAQNREFAKGIAFGIAFGIAAEISEFLARISAAAERDHASPKPPTDGA